MSKARFAARLLTCLTLCCTAGVAHAAPPTAAQMLEFKPRQPDVAISTPTEAELASCKVELVKGQKLANGKVSSGWLLKDSQGRPLRRFFDSDGDNHIDVYSYYLDGQECYREVDSNYNGKIDQYRWLGPNGGKWGVDTNEDGKIDAWKVISPEEVSQEVLKAVATNDVARLQALLISKAELDGLELPDSEAGRIRTSVAGAAARFKKTVESIPLDAKTRWVHLETAAPQCLTAEALGGKYDLVLHKHGTILYENGGKHDFLQTGEMVEVGHAWRIIDAPAAGSRGEVAPAVASGGVEIPEQIKGFVEQLKKVDEASPKSGAEPEEMARYTVARADVLEKIVEALKGEQQEQWLRQLADSLSAAAQSAPSQKAPYERLVAWRDRVVKQGANAPLAAYVVFREMAADYAIKLATSKPDEMGKLQDAWKDRLAKFVTDYPTAEDAPDALMQLGIVSESAGKETEAKNWYKQLADNFKQDPLAAKASGALRRLGLEGQDFELAGGTLGGNAPFDVKSLKGKVIVVYYWASWNRQCASDFARLKTILAGQADKVELVTVSLDNAAPKASDFLRQNPIPGTHLFQQGGFESGLAVNYGVFLLPSTFIIGADGKVVSRNAQVTTLEDDLKKLLK
jgi:thiol-disulfide isomerase/thioredoxin